MKSAIGPLLILASLAFGSAEAQPGSQGTVTTNQANRVQPVQRGRVTHVRSVQIRPGQTHLGTTTGAVLGGIAGSQIGGGAASNAAGGIAGAVVGSRLGSRAQGARTTAGVEVTVELTNGQKVAIIQPGRVHDFRVGDHVRVIGTMENARVSR